MLTSRGGRPTMAPKTMLGAFVRDRRINHLHLSVREAAALWSLTESAIYMIERGERSELKPDTLLKLAGGLGITVDKLLRASIEEAPTSDRPNGRHRTRKPTATT